VTETVDRTPWSARSSGTQRLLRGVRQRCPRCGEHGIASSFFELAEKCPGCSWRFEREEGYWLGAMIVLIGVVEAAFGVFFVGGMLLTWPDVPWTTLLIGGLALNAVMPFLAYRWSKTTWMGLHTMFVPAVLETDDPSRDGS
jgi:uncharacterized protein (DUF983 family)